jgi:hypothetical protein
MTMEVVNHDKLCNRSEHGRNTDTDSVRTTTDADINMGHDMGDDIHAVIQKYAW